MIDSLESYEPIVGKAVLARLTQLAGPLKGASIVHVNSTKEGGGVAEILARFVPLANQLGLENTWEVVEGNEAFFHTTKTIHNTLQGGRGELTGDMIRAYNEVQEENAERLRPILTEADFVIIHDPQPAGLLKLCPDRKGKWIWRCHIDASTPRRNVWNFLRPHIVDFDASIFSMPDFAQPLPHPQFIIPPSIDPLSEKNRDIEDSVIRSTLDELEISGDLPLLTQISRFDRFKDPLGVIEAYKMIAKEFDAELLLVGGTASDDPEGQEVFDELQEAAKGDERIHTIMLPPDAHTMINALQRASDIIIQKSIREGFGLTVTEGLWKGKPVIGGNVGGIQLQIRNGFDGFLSESPEGAALWIRYLLNHPHAGREMGERGKEYVRKHFLLTRLIREYLTIFRFLNDARNHRLIA